MISNSDYAQDYAQEYQQAEAAYLQGHYDRAASIIDAIVAKFSSDPSVRLLRGHIYCYGLHQHEIGKQEYEYVLTITTDLEFVQFAQSGLDYANSCLDQTGGDTSMHPLAGDSGGHYRETHAEPQELMTWRQPEDLTADEEFDLAAFNFNVELSGQSFETRATDFAPTTNNGSNDRDRHSLATGFFNNEQETLTDAFAFGYSQDLSANQTPELEPSPPTFDDDGGEDTGFFNISAAPVRGSASYEPNAIASAAELEDREEDTGSLGFGNPALASSPLQFSVSEAQAEADRPAEPTANFVPSPQPEFSVADISDALESISNSLTAAASSNGFGELVSSSELKFEPDPGVPQTEALLSPTLSFTANYDDDDLGTPSAFLEAFKPEIIQGSKGNEPNFPDETGFGSMSADPESPVMDKLVAGGIPATPANSTMFEDNSSTFINGVSISGIKTPQSESMSNFLREERTNLTNLRTTEAGMFAAFDNATSQKKQWLISGAAGLGVAIAIGGVTFISSLTLNPETAKTARGPVQQTGAIMALLGGLTGFGVTKILAGRYAKQVNRYVMDLQSNFEQVAQGNMGARASIYSQDELGQLSSSFNQMIHSVVTSNGEAQRKAREMEQAKDELQRQVIRLLDDVEGAARGDLTVKAEVTADVLGAVADSFNLTIDSLRQIVQQVQMAAVQVNQGSTDSEAFARRLSSDALRQAEELAVTVNSVQMMTASIKRVADSARESEEVARTASSTALKGGEAVERTVAGILEIRETVAESTRKVKRLAESSQQISQIVSVISQIASRTNLLALNASIEAARAGEAGKGFAIVADEVRQLADRSAKALKEIEQIVLQIQSETGSVMAAMEQGTQQVIQGTKLAEEAKKSLDDIIQVSNRIDALVRSITADTIEQRETSKAVTEVMQSVEIQAQSTSQEAQKVSSSLENLVVVARNLLTYVERFKVE
jgi:twitching motility protein PilJ